MTLFFKELFEYSHHYNQQVADTILEHAGKVSKKKIELFSHTLNAHHIWNRRLLEEEPLFAVWDVHDMNEFKTIDKNNFEQSLQIVENAAPESIISYTNSRQQHFSNTVRDILFHIINHSTYHRGQIATECKLHGILPLTTDYIFYKR